MIDKLMEWSGKDMRELNAVALSMGPGSYTGLRIGTSVAKGLCYALDIPLIGVDTLKAMTRAIMPYNVDKHWVCPMIDARRMEVYCLLMNASRELVIETSAIVLEKDTFSHYLEDHKILFFGNGAPKYREIIGQNPNAYFIDYVYPSAEQVGYLAEMKYHGKEWENLAYFQPNYLKKFTGTKPNKKVF